MVTNVLRISFVANIKRMKGSGYEKVPNDHDGTLILTAVFQS